MNLNISSKSLNRSIAILVVLWLCNLKIFSQSTKEKFSERNCTCYSIETSTFVNNEGASRYNDLPSVDDPQKNNLAKKYLKTLEKANTNAEEEISNYRLIQDTKDIIFTTVGAFTKESILGSSIILDPLYDLKDKENQRRFENFEKQEVEKVKSQINAGIDEIIKEGNPYELKSIINSDSPLFVNTEAGVAYNKALIEAVAKLGESERERMENLITVNRENLERIYQEQTEIISNVVKLEVWATASFEEQKAIIESNREAIKNNSTAILENNRLIKQNALRVSILETTIVNHDMRISKNTAAIQKITLNSLWDRASLEEKIEGLENGKFDDLFTNEAGQVDNDAISKLIEQSKNLKLRKDVHEGAQQVSRWGKAASQLFSDIDPNLAETIDKGIAISNIVGNYALGNYPEAAMGAMSLVGIGGKPGPSTETILLKRVLKEISILKEEMHSRFDRVDESLRLIDGKISDVQEYLQAMNRDIVQMHISTQNELNIIKSKLDFLNNKLDCIEKRINALELKDLNTCEVPSAFIRNGKATTYGQYLQLLDLANCENCVESLENFINMGILSKDVFDYVECDIDFEERKLSDGDVFAHLRNLWQEQWGQNEEKAFDAMFYPPKYNLENPTAFIALATLDKEWEYRNFKFLDQGFSERLKSPLTIERITNYFLTFYPALEIYQGNQKFLSFEEVIQKDFQVDNTTLYNHLDYLLELTDYALAQQSLMSGHLMLRKAKQILLSGTAKDLLALEAVLYNNEVFLFNLINNYLAVDYHLVSGDDKLINLRNTENLLVQLNKKNDEYWEFKIERNYNLNGESKVLKIARSIKPFTEINKNPKFLLYPDFFRLLAIRKRLTQKKMELDFIKSLETSPRETNLSVKEFNQLIINNYYEKP